MRRGQEEGIDEVPDGGERRRREVLRYRSVLLLPITDQQGEERDRCGCRRRRQGRHRSGKPCGTNAEAEMMPDGRCNC
ncbi:unnamed protein product [Musa hybrid cultivar]